MEHTSSKGSEHVDEEVPRANDTKTATKRRGGCIGCCIKWWWLHLIIFVVIAVAVTCGVIFGAVPKLAQKNVNNSKIEVYSMKLSNPTNDSFTLDMSSKITGTGPFHATLAPMIVELSAFPNGTTDFDFSKQVVFATLPLPEVHAGPGGAWANITGQVIMIKDGAAFDQFGKNLVTLPSFYMGMKGKTKLTPKGLKATEVTMEKKILVNGMNMLKGIAITNYDIPGENQQGLILAANSTVPNSSNTTVFLGDTYFNVSFSGLVIGECVLKNFTLKQNMDNEGFLEGTMYRSVLKDQILLTSGLFSAAVSNANQPLQVTGTKSIVNGDENPWLSAAAKNIKVEVPLHLKDGPPKIISGIVLSNTEMDFPAPASDAVFGGAVNDGKLYKAQLSSGITANVTMPFGFEIQIKGVSQNLTMVSSDGIGYAVLTTAPGVYSPANMTNTTGLVLNTTAKNVTVNILDHTKFGDFLGDVLTKDVVDLKLGGSVGASVTSSLGSSMIQGIVVDDVVQLKGLNSFTGQNISISDVQVIGGKAASEPDGGLQMACTVTLNSPSDLTANVGDVILDVYFENKIVGTSLIQGLTVQPGVNTMKANVTMNPPEDSKDAAEKLLTQFANGVDSVITLKGSDKSSAVPGIAAGFKKLSFDATLPSAGYKFLASGKLFNGTTITSTVNVLNPFDAPIKLQRISANLTAALLGSSDVVATIDDQEIDGTVVPPNTGSPGVEQPAVKVDSKVSPIIVFQLLDSQKSMDVEVQSKLEVLIGDFLATLDYTAKNVTITHGT